MAPPPPSAVQVQPVAGAPAVALAVKTPMSIWWPMSFLIAWVLLTALGGGLLGAGLGTDNYSCDENDDCSDYGDPDNMILGGIVCLSISGLFSLVFWILLIVYLVQRSRYRAAYPTIVYVNAVPTATGASYHAWNGPHAPVPTYAGPYPTYSTAPPEVQHQPDPSSTPAPISYSDAPGPEMQGTHYCGPCGASVATPFCPHCGSRVQ